MSWGTANYSHSFCVSLRHDFMFFGGAVQAERNNHGYRHCASTAKEMTTPAPSTMEKVVAHLNANN